MAVNLATAYVELMPSMQGFHKKVASELGQVETAADKSGKKSGGIFSGAFGKVASAAKFAGIAAVGATAATSIIGGFTRAMDTQNFESSMAGLLGSAEKAAESVDRVNKVASGSSIDAGAYRGFAQSLAYVGVEGQQAESVMKNVGKAITGAGGDATQFDSITTALTAMSNEGKVTNDRLNQMSNAGLPVLDALSTKLGVDIPAVQKMATDGLLEVGDVIDVLENGTGEWMEKLTAAGDEVDKGLGPAFTRLKDNAFEAIGKGIGPLLDAAAPAVSSLADGIGSLGEKIGPVFGGIKDAIGGLFEGEGGGFLDPIKDAFASIKDIFSEIDLGAIFDSLKGAGEKVMPILEQVGGFLKDVFGVAVEHVGGLLKSFGEHAKRVWDAMKGPLESVANTVKEKVLPTFQGIAEWAREQVPKLSGMFESVRKVFDTLSPVLAKIAGVVGGVLATAFKIIWTILKPVIAILKPVIGFLISVLGVIFKVVAGVIAALAPVVTWLIDVLMNPLKTIFSAIGAVVTWLWQNVMLPAWNGIKAAIGFVWDWISGTLWPGLQNVWNGLATVIMWLWNNVITPAWNGIKAAIAAVWGWISGTLWPGLQRVWNAIATIALWLWNNIIVPAWDGIQNAISVAGDIIRGVIDGIKGFFQGLADKAGAVKDWIVEKFTALVDFVKGLPGKIASAAKGMWDGLKEAFRGAINWIISKWNNFELKITLPSVLGGGEISIGTPDIPLFAAGGKVSGPGTGTSDSILAALSNGEFVVNAKATRQWLPFLTAINGGNGDGQRGGLPAFANGGLVAGAALPARGGEGGLKPISVMVRRLIMTAWEQIKDIGGYRASDPFPDHPSGQALDIMLSDVALGDKVKAWLMDNKQLFDLNYTIWQQKYHPANGSASMMEDRGSPTQNHMDHIHALFGKLGSPPNVNPNVVPEGINWPTDMRPEPIDVNVKPDGVEGSWGDTGGSDPAAPPADATGGSAGTQDKSSISGIFGDAMKEQMGDLLGFFSIPDSPSLLAAYNEYEKTKDGADKTTATGDGKGPVDPAAEAEAKRAFEDLAVKRKRAHEDELAKIDADYAAKIAGTKDAAEKRKLREEQTAKKRELKRSFEDAEREEKRKYEDEKRKRAEAAKTPQTSGTTAPSAVPETGEAGMPDTPTTEPAPDPNKPPTVVWKQGDGPEPWRPVLEWAIKRVGKGLSAAKPQIDAGVKQIGSESGGDPNIAQQIVDVNGTGDAAGVGLLQIIPNTWKANRDPELPDDRRNGPANIVGALRYYVGRYGPDLTKMWGHNRGYRKGGYTGNLGLNEVAGHVHGREFVVNASATRQWRPELEAMNSGARPAELAATATSVGRGGTKTVNYVTLRDERAYYERRKREERLAAARMK